MDSHDVEDPEQEYARVLTVAKEALKYIGVFRTPPTPGVYDVWYRYVEGTDRVLHEQLEHAVTVSKSVSKDLLEYCYQQKIADVSGSESLETVSNRLAHEISSLTSLLSAALKESEGIEESVLSSRDSIQDLAPTPQMIRTCIEQLLSSNDAMRAQLTATRVQMEQSQAQVNQLKANLLESQKSLLTDSLTGIGNRRYCQSAMKHAVLQRQEVDSRTYLFLVDLDNLKSINNSYGHAVGDDVIRHTSQVLQTLLPNASLARFAGDVFVLIQNHQDHATVTSQAALIREQFSGRAFVSKRIGEKLNQITVSIGCALLRATDDELTWLDRARNLLASAKQSGGNQVMIERVI
jgi:diguanylate cyclase